MGYTEELLPGYLYILSSALYLLIVARALFSADWLRFSLERNVQHFIFGGVFCLICLWQIKAGLSPGLTVHLIGMSILTLILGWQLAVLTGLLASVLSALVFGRLSVALPLEALLTTVVPILVTSAVVSWERRMGFRLFFAYMFICGFFAAALGAAGTVIVSSLLLWGFGVYDFEHLSHEYLQYIPLIMLPEGFVNGILTAGLVIYFPERLITFDSSRYE